MGSLNKDGVDFRGVGVFPLYGDGADLLDGDKVASLIGVEADLLDTDADMDFLGGE